MKKENILKSNMVNDNASSQNIKNRHISDLLNILEKFQKFKLNDFKTNLLNETHKNSLIHYQNKLTSQQIAISVDYKCVSQCFAENTSQQISGNNKNNKIKNKIVNKKELVNNNKTEINNKFLNRINTTNPLKITSMNKTSNKKARLETEASNKEAKLYKEVSNSKARLDKEVSNSHVINLNYDFSNKLSTNNINDSKNTSSNNYSSDVLNIQRFNSNAELTCLKLPLTKLNRDKKDQFDPSLVNNVNNNSYKTISQTIDKKQQKLKDNDIKLLNSNSKKTNNTLKSDERKISSLNNLNNESNFSKETLKEISSYLKFPKKDLIEQILNKEKENRTKKFINNVSTYVNLYLKLGLLKEAQHFMTNCFFKCKQLQTSKNIHLKKKNEIKIISIEVYNSLMRAWAKKGHYDAILKLFLQIKELKIKPNLETLGSFFECMGRNQYARIHFKDKLMKDFEKENLVLENMFLEGFYDEIETELISNTIKEFYPDIKFISKQFVQGQSSSDWNKEKTIINPFKIDLDINMMSELSQKQMDIDCQDHVVVETIEPGYNITPDVINARKLLQEEKETWKIALKKGFLASQQYLEIYNNSSSSNFSLVPFLKLWNVDFYVELMLKEIDILGQELSNFSPICAHFHIELGTKIFNKFLVQIKKKENYMSNMLKAYNMYLEEFNRKEIHLNHRNIWSKIIQENNFENLLKDEHVWSLSNRRDLGKFLYSIIISEIKIKRSQKSDGKGASVVQKIPAIFTIFRMQNGNPSEELVPHPMFTKLYEDAKIRELTFRPTDLPLLVPPVPWINHYSGGNLINSIDLIRNQSVTRKQSEWLSTFPTQSIFPMLDGLNTISACPWKINTRILDLVIEIFNKGGNWKLNIPEKNEKYSNVQKISQEMIFEDKMKLLKQNQLAIKENKENYSLWCTELYRLSIANKFRNSIFWFPNSVDFRGRAYPTPPHFNHLGNDVARSLLKFGVGKKLGPTGLNWLKIHLINLTGYMKRNSNEDRLKKANELLPKIFQSADKPFEGDQWWQSSDEPWQTLACCIEITEALRFPNPEKFISFLPVHQDGSCNGLQHYAALGRDEAGARSVSLLPSEAPRDVYSDIVELIEQDRCKDAQAELPIAKSLDGFVKRHVVKQSIMTTVYGVTKYGAKKQIGGQLKDIENFPIDLKFASQTYLADKTFGALKKLFTSSEEIQKWFSLCSDIITTINQASVHWITPIGWPVIQPYVKQARIYNKNGSTVLYEKPNSMKQKNAFAPNFIHSLDSTHMILTAIHCLEDGILFASVHDCFWTHAADVHIMNKICREQFVALHFKPILEDLAQHFVKNFGYTDADLEIENEVRKKSKEIINKIFWNVPKKGVFNINEILNSTYFFS